MDVGFQHMALVVMVHCHVPVLLTRLLKQSLGSILVVIWIVYNVPVELII